MHAAAVTHVLHRVWPDVSWKVPGVHTSQKVLPILLLKVPTGHLYSNECVIQTGSCAACDNHTTGGAGRTLRQVPWQDMLSPHACFLLCELYVTKAAAITSLPAE
jgi:hypothetical protein